MKVVEQLVWVATGFPAIAAYIGLAALSAARAIICDSRAGNNAEQVDLETEIRDLRAELKAVSKERDVAVARYTTWRAHAIKAKAALDLVPNESVAEPWYAKQRAN